MAERSSPGPDLPSGVIVAGGRSRRMGRDKALLDLGGRPVIARVAGSLASACAEVLVAGGEPGRYAFLGLREAPDRYPGLGPLAGVHAGLDAMARPAGLFVACDMPFLSSHLLHGLARRGAEGDVDAVVPRVAGRPEPLCAWYRRTLLPAAEAVLDRGGGPVAALWEAPGARITWMEEDELRRLDPELLSFANLNSPGDYDRARRRWAGDAGAG